MIAAPIISKKTLIDHYLECGDVAPFLGLSAILFLWLLFICGLWVLRKQPSFHFQLLLPCALLPVMIGLFGSSLGLYEVLDFKPSPYACEAIFRPAEAVLPLLAGSFLSTCFLSLSLVILFIKGSALAKQQLMAGTRLSGIRPDESP
jgi:hypothetical protein